MRQIGYYTLPSCGPKRFRLRAQAMEGRRIICKIDKAHPQLEFTLFPRLEDGSEVTYYTLSSYGFRCLLNWVSDVLTKTKGSTLFIDQSEVDDICVITDL